MADCVSPLVAVKRATRTTGQARAGGIIPISATQGGPEPGAALCPTGVELDPAGSTER
jgi:hypothetical protein